MRALAPVTVALALAGLACRSSKPSGSHPSVRASSSAEAANPGAAARATPSTVPSARPPPGLQPLGGDGSPLRGLAVDGFGEAVVSLPLGATAPRPVVLALHGNYDRPEWQCTVWREITAGYPWVLCPRGVRRQDAPRGADRWTFVGLERFEKEVHAGLEALKRHHGPYVDPEHPIFTAFSLGAILGVHLLKKPQNPFQRAVLIEGGYEGWGVAGARAFARTGGSNVLFGCGQTACVHAAKRVTRLFGEGPVSAEVVSGGNVGHTYDGSVAEAVRERWEWLTAGDPRFSVTGSETSP